MAQKIDESELVSFKELLMANSMEVDTVTNLCIQLGIFTEQNFYLEKGDFLSISLFDEEKIMDVMQIYK